MNAPWTWGGVHGSHVAGLWPVVWPILKPCVELDEGRYDEESVQAALESGGMQLWVVGRDDPKLAVTTELRFYPRQQWCNIKYVGGEGLPHAFDFLGIIEAWAKAQGCVGVEGYGRHEWARLLEKQGYTVRGLGYQRKFDV